MNNAAIINILEEMAVYLELADANTFRIKAYENGARAISGLQEPLTKYIANQTLTSIKGIGKGLAETILELHRTGHIAELDRLKSKIPTGLIEMIKIPGFGPKKARQVWQILGLTTLVELEQACAANKLVDIKGFGTKSQEKILTGIAALKRFAGRFHINTTQTQAQEIVSRLKQQPSVSRIEVAGSLRRCLETCKDIDVLVSASDPQAVMAAFVGMDGVGEVIAHGPTKSSVRLNTGQNADLRIVTETQFPFALLYFTGSKEHNTELRGRAKKLGLKLNEYGLFRDDDTSLICATETDIFAALGLTYIPPELREAREEFAAAEQNAIPRLIELRDLRGILHSHTTYSDGGNTLADMAAACRQRGYAYFGVCDHSQSAVYANGLKPERILAQHTEIDALNQQWSDFRILKGIESDILADGSLDYPDDILKLFDLIVVSVHSQFNLSEDEQTRRMIRAVENPFATILAHPTGRILLGRDGYAINLTKVLDACAANGTVVEINANPQRLDMDWRMIGYALNKGCKLAINPDAHSVAGLDDVQYGVGVARKGGVTKRDVINCLDYDDWL